MKKNIKLIAIDMDGTLLNDANEITRENQEAIKAASAQGINVVLSTGRPYVGIHPEELAPLGISYAITANGSAVYTVPDKKCIYTSSMSWELVCPIIRELQKLDIQYDAFIDGCRFGQRSCFPVIDKLAMPEATKEYIRTSGSPQEDLAAYIESNRLDVQKMTLNFYPLEDGSYKDRDTVARLLTQNPKITFVSGGYHDIEFTKEGTTKALGLRYLADMLGVSIEETMAIGDTENDMDMLQAARLSVAMGNAIDELKSAADFVTLSNEESGVAHAIRELVL